MDATRWFHIIGLISAGTLGVGFITGVISVLLSWKINREQEAKMGQLSLTIGVLEKTAVDAKTAQQKVEIELVKQQERAAKAETAQQKVELELAKQQERTAKAELAVQQLRKRQEPRRLDHRKFAESLKGKSTGKAQLFYQPEDGEAFLVAFELHGALSSLGWQVTLPMPIPPDLTGEGTRGASTEVKSMLPSTLRAAGQPLGVSIIANSLESSRTDSLYNVLSKGILDSLGGVGGGLDKSLPDDVVRIIIGPKP